MYHFIVNPHSRSKKGENLWAVISSILEAQKITYAVHFTEYAGHAVQLAHEVTSTYPDCTLVAIGGDGTIHEVLTGITHHDTITFGYIPAGSGNDFARGMTIPANYADALNVILHPTVYQNMDIGMAVFADGKQCFGVSCGIGFDASVCHEVDISPAKTILNKLHLGSMTYALLAVKQLLFYKPYEIYLTFDDQEQQHFKKTYFAAAFNQKYEGGGVMMAPDAKPDDGLMDIVVAEGVPKIVVLCVLPLAFFGLHRYVRGVHIYRCKKVKIKCRRENHLHLDGDPCGMHRQLTIAIHPKTLKVIAG